MSIDLSLGRLRSFLAHLPVQYRRPTIHIAGTNGKGSISAIVSSILVSSSPPLSVGRYNSPHLTKITDCITIQAEPIDDATYQQTRAEFEALAVNRGINLSPFEILTVTALVLFERAQVDVVVLEVGMGGRLDATNIIPSESVLVSALSTVDLDHQNFLGPTVDAIAKEKSGIARAGKPFVLGRQRYSTVEPVVKEILEGIGAIIEHPVPVQKDEKAAASAVSLQAKCDGAFDFPPPHHVQFRLPSLGGDPVLTSFPLPGDHQLDNLSTSLGIIDAILRSPASPALRITTESVQDGVKNVRWRGRMSWHALDLKKLTGETVKDSHPILVDGAHNPGSSQALSDYIHRVVSQLEPQTNVHLHCILAVSHSPPKSPQETLRPILTNLPPRIVSVHSHIVRFTLPDQMPWVTPVAPLDLANVIRTFDLKGAIHAPWNTDVSMDSVNEELVEALQCIASVIGDDITTNPSHHLVVLAGSLYLVADFYRLLDSGSI